MKHQPRDRRVTATWLVVTLSVLAAAVAWLRWGAPVELIPSRTAAPVVLEPGRFQAAAATEARRGDWTLHLAAGTAVQVAPQGLPIVIDGSYSVELLAAALWGDLALEPLEPSRLVVRADGLTVAGGRLRIGDDEYGPGAVFTPAVATPAVPPAPPELPPAPAAATLTGRIVDARGNGLGGARLRVVFFRGGEGRAVAAEEAEPVPRPGRERAIALTAAASMPPRERADLESEPDGSFSLEVPDAGDARLAAHIEAHKPGFAPSSAVVASTWGGVREAVELALRPAHTVEVLVVDPSGRPIADAPLWVTPWVDAPDLLDAPEVLISRSGRLVRPGDRELRFTDERGTVVLAATEHPCDFELGDPEHSLYYRHLLHHQEGVVRMELPLEGTLRLETRRRWVQRLLLLDQDLLPLRDAELELRFEGVPPLFLRSDADGWVTVGIQPFLEGEPRLDYDRPRQGEIVTCTAELPGRATPVRLPSLEQELVLVGRSAPHLRLRTVRAEEPESPVAPRTVEVAADWTLLRLEPTGAVELCGPPPPPGSPLDVFVTGYLPARITVPAAERDADIVDLGDVPLAPGLRRAVVVATPRPSDLRGAWLAVSFAGDPTRFQRYRLEDCPGGRVEVTGLARGVHDLAVEGPGLVPLATVLEVNEAPDPEPLVLEPALAAAEAVHLHGRVMDLPPLEAVRCVVVERFLVAGVADPVVMPPYPLAPDGRFGSVRSLAGVSAAEAFVLSPVDLVAAGRAPRPFEGTPDFALGELRLGPGTRAEIAFTARDLGTVTPPLACAFVGEAGLSGLARLRLRRNRLIVDGLRAGQHTLRWREPDSGTPGDGPVGTIGIEVPREHLAKIELVAERARADEEALEVLAIDASGAPVPGAHVTPPARGVGPPPEDPGVCLAPVSASRTTAFSVAAGGFLQTHVRVEPGGAIPTRLTLHRGVRARATVLDAEGRRVDGLVTASWEPLQPAAVRHGEPVSDVASSGLVELAELPPLPLDFTFRLAGSELAVRRELTLKADVEVNDLGVLRFEETRRLRGSVHLWDGSPASGATVAIVERRKARRYPLREGGVAAAIQATTTGAEGTFVLDGVPLDLGRPEELALVAHLDGFTDAVEEPLELDAGHHGFLLRPEARLLVRVGYRDDVARRSHGFWLDHRQDPADPDSRAEIGELPEALHGGHVFTGIEPGIYRVRWGLRRAYSPLAAAWDEVEVVPGRESSLTLVPEGRSLRGRVTLNGKGVSAGWIILTDEPGVPGSARVGWVKDGELEVIDPPTSDRTYGAVLPERQPQPLQNLTRGEALPVLVPGYAHALRAGQLTFNYVAHSVEFRFEDDFLAEHPGAVLSLAHYEWQRNRFERFPAEELIEEPVLRLELLEPGSHKLAVRSARGNLIYSTVLDLRADETIVVR